MNEQEWNDRIRIYVRGERTAEDLTNLKKDLTYQYADDHYKAPIVIDGGGTRWQTERDFKTEQADIIRIFGPEPTKERAVEIYRIPTRLGNLFVRRVQAQTFQHPSEVARGCTYEECTPTGTLVTCAPLFAGLTIEQVTEMGGVRV